LTPPGGDRREAPLNPLPGRCGCDNKPNSTASQKNSPNAALLQLASFFFVSRQDVFRENINFRENIKLGLVQSEPEA